MNVFLSHTETDKDIVLPIGAFLESKGFDVWIDKWRMTAGDSLIKKIGDGIEASNRLIVCLTPQSVESEWVKKEVSTGLVMEIAEEKGLGEKFVIPALLSPCNVPIMLRDKVYVNFTNKAFPAACEELIAGITDKPSGPTDARLENRITRTYIRRGAPGKHALVVEFAVRMSPTEGLSLGIQFSAPYTSVVEWQGSPNNPEPPYDCSIHYSDGCRPRENKPTMYAHKFSSPSVTSTKSLYLLFEGESVFSVINLEYLDFFGRVP
jgi:hypothetical protein